jgi:membrane-associated phospholipid phosphatase
MSSYRTKAIHFASKKLILYCFIFLCVQPAFSQDKAVETSGDILLFALPAAALGTTFIIGDSKGTWQFTKGFLTNAAVTMVLKLAIDKQRPNMENNNAFPSGHTSMTFQSASFIQRRYGWKYGIPAYILSSYTGFTRVNADKHDVIDILAGAAIGIGSTYLFTTPYQQEHMELSFGKLDDTYLVGFKFKF